AEKQESELLALGRIEPSSSPTAAAAFFVNKQCRSCNQLKCSCGKRDYPRRWVIDFRPLNNLVKQDAYPLPSVPELLSVAAGHKKYIKFDIDSAFHLVPVRLEDKHKLAFLSHKHGLMQWTVMHFGYKNVPATFQRMIDTVLAPARAYCRAFMDDGLVWGDSDQEVSERFRHVLELLRKAGL